MSLALPISRLSADERRTRILDAALKVFSEKGFHGATTRELAKAAGVSEALIFRHFPSKEDLYAALQTYCCRSKAGEKAEMLANLSDSTASLVTLVHYLMAKMLRPLEAVPPEEQALHRLLANSFIEDGQFATGFMESAGKDFQLKLESCLTAAIKAGDAVDLPVRAHVGASMVKHLAGMLMFNEMPGRPVVNLGIDRAQQVEQAVWFALLGLGVRAEAVRQHYHPEAFALLMS